MRTLATPLVFLSRKSVTETIRCLFVGTMMVGLTACGGGSSSGASQAGPAPSAFAGTYNGQMTFSAQGVSGTEPIAITVSRVGKVTIITPPSSGACIRDASPGTPYLAGSRINIGGSGSCYLPGLGTCDVSLQGQLRFSSSNAVGGGDMDIVCPGKPRLTITFGIGATKV